MNLVDLFCNIGGFSYGFKKAGFNAVLGVDVDGCRLRTYSRNVCSQVLEKNIAEVSKEDIVSKIGNIPIHVIVGSPPCEAYAKSNPNKLRLNSVNEADFELACHFYRIVREFSPCFFIMENVPRFFKAHFIKQVLFKRFELLGYTLSYNQIRAEQYGIPQRRERGFLIGGFYKQKIYIKPTHIRPIDQITLDQAIGDLRVLEPMEKNDMSAMTIHDQAFSAYQRLMHTGGKARIIYNHVAPGNTDKIKEVIQNIKPGGYYGKNKYHTRSIGSDISKVITTKFGSPSNDGETMHYALNRCLTFREAARIQSFDDNFVIDVASVSREKIREMIGDAVPPLLAEIFATKLIEISSYCNLNNRKRLVSQP